MTLKNYAEVLNKYIKEHPRTADMEFVMFDHKEELYTYVPAKFNPARMDKLGEFEYMFGEELIQSKDSKLAFKDCNSVCIN